MFNLNDLTFRQANISDAEGIKQVYLDSEVEKQQINSIIKEQKKCFSGIFKIPDVKEMLEDQSIEFLVACQEDGEIIAFTSWQNNTTSLDHAWQLQTDFNNKINDLKQKEEIGSVLDVVTKKKFRSHGIGTKLYELMFKSFLKKSKSHALIEIYTIKEILNNNKKIITKIESPNCSQNYQCLLTGAKLIGEVKRPLQAVVNFPGFVAVQANIFLAKTNFIFASNSSKK